MLIIELIGGLGNMLFEIASTYSLSKIMGHSFAIAYIPEPPPQHSKINYKNNILKNFCSYVLTNKIPVHNIICDESHLINLKQLGNKHLNIVIRGYLQMEMYIRPHRLEIINLLNFDNSILEKYPNINNSFFIHIRRGDYVKNSFHELNLDNYYKTAIEKMPADSMCMVFSNDIEWCKNYHILKDYNTIFIEENEVDSLNLMKNCKIGGIIANSSFSWWGAYLDISRKHLYCPSVWFPDQNLFQMGYYYPEINIIEI